MFFFGKHFQEKVGSKTKIFLHSLTYYTNILFQIFLIYLLDLRYLQEPKRIFLLLKDNKYWFSYIFLKLATSVLFKNNVNLKSNSC
jgi:hypothetical protein